ncbi:thiaminase II [Actinocrispum wychmicini]|uniref:Aminopyrimidine aminohydrolase n=1 Tax=Actinocrispum wychmicini TaxID=1213861 RepID=A0A4R2K3Z2_9PSEU|nr:thiaminase II [Actinocrispum wychmicini]TCO64498.1 thiaminase/transcriptional activator TenA [Actinocrispum wychmicini]
MFTEQAWTRTERLQRAIVELPFNTELAAGTLSPERFRFYLAQDARYLVGFGRALAIAAARADDHDEVAFFAASAHDAVVEERRMHQSYFARFGMSEPDLAAIGTSPTCLAYTSYLLAVAQTGSYAELVAALLPCFWVYHHVGTDILNRQHGENPYREWIETYADEGFGEAVAKCRAAADRTFFTVDSDTRERMFAAFQQATEYEWLFWDSAWRLETWPTARFRN